MGIDIGRTYALTFGIGAALAAASGTLLSTTSGFAPNGFGAFNVLAFSVVVLGGLGSIPGALLGGLVFGLVYEFGGTYVLSQRDVVIFAILILVLVRHARPACWAARATADEPRDEPRDLRRGRRCWRSWRRGRASPPWLAPHWRPAALFALMLVAPVHLQQHVDPLRRPDRDVHRLRLEHHRRLHRLRRLRQRRLPRPRARSSRRAS